MICYMKVKVVNMLRERILYSSLSGPRTCKMHGYVNLDLPRRWQGEKGLTGAGS